MIKIDVFAGFLGAGKTTLIKKLLEDGFAEKRIVLLENEFGDVSVDGAFVKEAKKQIEITELSSGCVCCSLSGDFTGRMEEIIGWLSPERILIEPSGVAKLSELLRNLQDVKKRCEAAGDDIMINSVSTVVDVEKYFMYLDNFEEFYEDQIRYASCLILSRTGKAEAKDTEACLQSIRSMNGSAGIISTPWEKISGKEMLSFMEGQSSLQAELEQMEQETCPVCGHVHEHGDEHDHHHGHHHDHHHDHAHDHHDHHHDADEAFQTWGVETARSYNKEELHKILLSLDNRETFGQILRAKGTVASDTDSCIYFDYVPGEISLREGAACAVGRICVIGSGIQKEELGRAFAGESV